MPKTVDSFPTLPRNVKVLLPIININKKKISTFFNLLLMHYCSTFPTLFLSMARTFVILHKMTISDFMKLYRGRGSYRGVESRSKLLSTVFITD